MSIHKRPALCFYGSFDKTRNGPKKHFYMRVCFRSHKLSKGAAIEQQTARALGISRFHFPRWSEALEHPTEIAMKKINLAASARQRDPRCREINREQDGGGDGRERKIKQRKRLLDLSEGWMLMLLELLHLDKNKSAICMRGEGWTRRQYTHREKIFKRMKFLGGVSDQQRTLIAFHSISSSSILVRTARIFETQTGLDWRPGEREAFPRSGDSLASVFLSFYPVTFLFCSNAWQTCMEQCFCFWRATQSGWVSRVAPRRLGTTTVGDTLVKRSPPRIEYTSWYLRHQAEHLFENASIRWPLLQAVQAWIGLNAVRAYRMWSPLSKHAHSFGALWIVCHPFKHRPLQWKRCLLAKTYRLLNQDIKFLLSRCVLPREVSTQEKGEVIQKYYHKMIKKK